LILCPYNYKVGSIQPTEVPAKLDMFLHQEDVHVENGSTGIVGTRDGT
jgi:hypothetical protein